MADADEIHKDRTERWFVRQGLPNLIDHYSVREDVLTRMFPFLGWWCSSNSSSCSATAGRASDRPSPFSAVSASCSVRSLPVNRLRGRPAWMIPDTSGVPELVLFFMLTSIPTAIGAEGARSEDLLYVLGFNLVILAVGFVLTAWGIIPMLRWSLGQVWAQMNDIANLAMKSLPILLIFSAFIFVNAEMWQVASDFETPVTEIVPSGS